MPRVFSYIVARDFGFAPNPFHGFCTLADCKPTVRRVADVGDLIVGTGGAKYGLTGRLVYAMRVSERLTFDQFWNDPRFDAKKPTFAGCLMDAYGDNIYEPLPNGSFQQHHSHHSFPDGSTNLFNRNKDTSANSVLIADDFVFWGRQGPVVPPHLQNFHGLNLCPSNRGHRSNFPPDMVDAIFEWFAAIPNRALQGVPAEWK